ncbi:UDP-N-acetylmuramoyl-L-alanine--D-glutamate ligase [Candidatus Aerophobetes bacterium]|uniref:UDP-N-acetylmuramoylalanine--D-glutamate ligase n=1 Tax=Aerophobetes bacterium TaxID=2030807 RepID=A0A2A4YI87_UNCAE|nr:MAG: UDP-N-acetylmuramoyl-L-alanine--D-glutamate ligase [Candidatus Aerophobetes bacterium]
MKKKALILGLGVSGSAAKDFLVKMGYRVFIVDNKNDKHLSIDLVKSVDLAVISPGVPKENSFYKLICKYAKNFVGEAELGLLNIFKEDNKTKIIAVTGTNGKTTLCLFLEHLLSAKALGNVGIPFTRYLEMQERNKTIIAELSSFQIETLKAKVIDTAIITNISPDHLDRYKDFDEYARSKLFIAACIKKGGKLILPKEIFSKYKTETFQNDIKVIFIEDLMKIYTCEDVENPIGIEAFIIAKEIAGDAFLNEVFLEKLKTFKKPPHRLEIFANISGISFVDDSKATNIESTLFAAKSILAKKHIIMGGSDKGLDFNQLLSLTKEGVVAVYAIGDCAKKIQLALQEKMPVTLYRNLEDATLAAFKLAKSNDVVLLSPGCPSYDHFDNFEHRGRVFKQCVYKIQKEEFFR